MMWLFMELHIKKIILTLIMVICIADVRLLLFIWNRPITVCNWNENFQVNVIHFGFVIGTVTAMMLSTQLQDIVIKLTSVTAAITLLAQMIFQIDHFTADQWSVTCMVGLIILCSLKVLLRPNLLDSSNFEIMPNYIGICNY